MLIGTSEPKLGQELALMLCWDGFNAEAMHFDPERPETIATASKEILKKFGRLDLLVCNGFLVDIDNGQSQISSGKNSDKGISEAQFTNNFKAMNLMIDLIHHAPGETVHDAMPCPRPAR